MSKFTRLGNALYTGRKSIDFVGRRWLWYAISAVIIIVAVLGLTFRGLNMSLEFTGGSSYTVTVDGTATQEMADELRTAVADTGVPAAEDPTVTTSGDHDLIVQIKTLDQDDNNTVIKAITDTTHVDASDITQDHVGASWGSEVAKKAITGLIVFLVLVVLFIWGYFREWKMSLAGIIALAHDVVITVGIYALSGFEVSPATVTGFLTILGFSLYDTVVVFDKIRENTKDLRGRHTTYAKAANLALNQTLVRSINTSLVALIPVAAILYVSAVQLGASTLKDLALALFVGMAAGLYSSVFIATPLLVHLKENEKEIQAAERRAKARAREADRYANVPALGPDAGGAGLDDSGIPMDFDELAETPTTVALNKPTSGFDTGRVAPPARGPVRESGASGRPQPERKPKSKRK